MSTEEDRTNVAEMSPKPSSQSNQSTEKPNTGEGITKTIPGTRKKALEVFEKEIIDPTSTLKETIHIFPPINPADNPPSINGKPEPKSDPDSKPKSKSEPLLSEIKVAKKPPTDYAREKDWGYEDPQKESTEKGKH